MSTEIDITKAVSKKLMDRLICDGALPGHASKPNEYTQHYQQVLGKAGAIEYFSLVEWTLQSTLQETKQ